MLFSKIIKKKFDAVLGRYDGPAGYYYFSPKDFPEIHAEPFEIPSDRKIMLQGAFYYYGSMNPDQLVVFDHGIGAGHLSYFKEIELLARNGYTVYSYDHTGCVSTGGTGIGGFAQGVSDLDHVLTVLEQDPRFAGKSIRLMGHSWGGYSCMNAAQFHPQVTHVVSLAGFLSAKALVEQYIPRMFLKYSPEVMDRERQLNPRYADLDARESLLKTNAKVMHLQSRNDQMVKFDLCYEPLEKALKDRKNTVLVAMDNRNHEPQLTDRGTRALQELTQKQKELDRKKQLATREQQDAFRKAQDWDLVTEQDPVIWGKILDFLKQ